MPAVRDSVFAEIASGSGLTIPICEYAAGDLLFAFLVGDTGTPTLGCTNGVGTWTSLFQQTNTAMHSVWWKYAAASGEGPVVFTSSLADSYCGWVSSVRDVFQGYTSGSPPVKNNTATAGVDNFNMPTISAQAKSLILMSSCNSSNQSAIIFGLGRGITQTLINGSAEGGAMGWFGQGAAGTTPSNIVCSHGILGPGVAAVIECRAPAGGATAFPTYVAADDSKLLFFSPGRAYDGSSTVLNTADTSFGTSIGGVTANDATLGLTYADYGIDPKGFLGSALMTSISSTTAISGGEGTAPAAKYNIGTSNILGHVRSLLMVDSQSIGPIGTTRGVWFGMKSGTAAPPSAVYKIWQVHGGDAPFYGTAVVPFVVNAGNLDTRATNGTFSSSDVRNYGWWVSGSGTLTTRLMLSSVWIMGTTTIAGGTTQEPVSIEGLEIALTKGKMRWSAIRNGTNQLLSLQAIQFGNGAVDPIILDLNTTAIEFPSQRDTSKKLVNYNGVDNIIGLTYYGGVGDTIKHRASIVSSPSKYHWRIHASSSSSATYDFSGLTVIGAGDVQLRAVTTFTSMIFVDCLTMYTNSALMNLCNFNNSKLICSTLGDMDNISNCAFVSSGTGHAIEVGGTATTISFSGNSFSGYAASSGSTGNEAIFINIASGTVTINIAGGGSTPSIRTAGAIVNVIAGAVTTLVTAIDEFEAVISGAAVALYAANGTANMPYKDTVTIVNSGTTATVTHTAHAMLSGDKVLIEGASHVLNRGVFTITVTGLNTYTYVMDSAPGSNPTGTITATWTAIFGETDVSGQISMSRVFSASQPVTGWVRKSTSSPYYKTGPVSGVISSTGGLSLTALLLRDE